MVSNGISKETDVSKEIESYKAAINHLNAQLEVHKQLFNETLQSNVNLRTQSLLLQQENQSLNTKITGLEKSVDVMSASTPIKPVANTKVAAK